MFWRSIALALALCLLARADVDPCKRQPFRGRCPSVNGAPLMRSQFVLRYYLRESECVSYPYGHCANDESEPKLFRYKEECEDACTKKTSEELKSNAVESQETPAPLEVDPEVTEASEVTVEQTYGTASAPVDSTTDSAYETPKTECQRQRDSRSQGLIKGGFVPECTKNGEFKQLQCEQDKSACFCVNSEGIEIDNSRTKGEKPDCGQIIAAAPQRTNDCVGKADVGPCKSQIPRWFYDESSQTCQQFAYSGCGGSGNNYPTEAACQKRCVPTKEAGKCHHGVEPLKTAQGRTVNCAKTDCPPGYKCSVIQQNSVCCPDIEKTPNVGNLVTGNACDQPKERGPCDRYELRFYFNKELKECKYFFFGGCEGNDNNFARVEDCEKTCGAVRSNHELPPTEPTTTPSTTTRTTPKPTTTTESPSLGPRIHLPVEIEPRTLPPTTTPELPTDRCLHPKDGGNCGGQFVRWLWNNNQRKCESFTYTGCGGNGNNFATQEECLSICHIEVVKPEPLPDVVNVCDAEVDVGECTGSFMRYAFDRTKGDCRQFQYGGCGGNGNNFATLNDCRRKCIPSKGPEIPLLPQTTTASTVLNTSLVVTPSLNVCTHPIEIGECSGVFQRFAYDGETNECRSFEYGGCGGNGNNFATLEECRSACVRVRCPPTPSCDTSRCQIVGDNRGCPFCSCPPPSIHPPLAPSIDARPQCPFLDVNLCVEPCIIFRNRHGCEECVCPVMPSQLPPQVLPTAPQPPPRPNPQPPVEVDLPPPPRPAPPAPSRQPAPPSPPSPPGFQRPPVSSIDSTRITRPPLPGVPTVTVAPVPVPVAPSHQIGLGEKCTQPVDPGPCKNFVERWHFNDQRGECEPFHYGGCAGNRNHFFSRRECEIHCARFSHETPAEQSTTVRVAVTSQTPVKTAPPVTTTATLPPPQPAPAFTPRPLVPRPTTEVFGPPQPPRTLENEICVLPPDSGNCTNYVPRYFYNAERGFCQEFSYGSCGGNANNFLDKFSCEAKCGLPAIAAALPARCQLPKQEGFGQGYFPKWYFNVKNLRCERLVYKGNNGNENQFESQQDCEQICQSRQVAPTAPPRETVPPRDPNKVGKKVPNNPALGVTNAEGTGGKFEELPASPAPYEPAPLPPATSAPQPPAEAPAPAPSPEAPAPVPVTDAPEPSSTNGAVESSSSGGYDARPAEDNMVPHPGMNLPPLGPSPTGGIDYHSGRPKVSGLPNQPARDKDTKDFDPNETPILLPPDDGLALIDEENKQPIKDDGPHIPLCPNEQDALRYENNQTVMCLPGRSNCPENSVCYFNGMDFYCCPNAEDPYDKHVFGGYDGEEEKHGYKSVPTHLNIRSLRARRQAALPPTAFSIDHITKPLRFDDKPITQISRAGSIDRLAHLRVNPCIQIVDKGECREAHLRFFYDIKVDSCRLFYYSGCGGNANNFASQKECEQRCKLGIVITTTTPEPRIPPGRCPGGKMPLGENAPVLCGNQTDSIDCPVGYYCRQGPPDVCCPDEPLNLQTILAASREREIRRKPFISAAGKFDGGHDHHHHHEEHAHAHGVATEHGPEGGYNTENADVAANAESIDASPAAETKAASAAAETGTAPASASASEAQSTSAASSSAGVASTTVNPISIPLPENMCPDGSDALLEADGKAKTCGAGFDGHAFCPKGYYCSIDLERNSRLCCPMSIQGSNIPPPPVDAPYFGHRRANPGEVVERGSLPSDPKPPKLSTPKPKMKSNAGDVESSGATEAESTAQFENSGVSGGNAEATGAGSEQVPPAAMPEGGHEKPYAHLMMKPVDPPSKLRKVIQAAVNSTRGIDEGHIRLSSAEDPFELDEKSRPRSKSPLDKSICQLKPTEGRVCREDEPSPKTNLQYYYSVVDKKCKLFFHHGCGGNLNRFDSKTACERFCMVQQ